MSRRRKLPPGPDWEAYAHSAEDKISAEKYRQMVAERERLEQRAVFEERISKSGTLSATAYHEAGHAVIADVLGHEIKEVSIVAKGRKAGRVRYKKMTATKEPEFLDLAVMALAGVIAQDRHCGTDDGLSTFLGGQGDMKQLMMAVDRQYLQKRKARHLPTYGTRHYWAMRHQTYFRMKRLEDETRKLVDKYWPAIERLAAILMSVKVVKGHDKLVAIIREAMSKH
jgi:ATP-dependent Zn protease